MGSILAIHAGDVKWSQRSTNNVSRQNPRCTGMRLVLRWSGITLERMIACTDVHYTNTRATAACILFRDWSDRHSDLAITEPVDEPAPYEPGRFYRRELPALLSVVSKLTVRPE